MRSRCREEKERRSSMRRVDRTGRRERRLRRKRATRTG
jgi:hypothetical protein